MALILIADVVSYLADLQDFTAVWLGRRHQFTRCLHPRGPAWSKNQLYSNSSTDLMMFNAELCYAGHSRRFTIGQAPLGGWELKIEEDHTVVSRVLYTDWHRVERALLAVTRRVSELEAGGWRSLPTPSTTQTE